MTNKRNYSPETRTYASGFRKEIRDKRGTRKSFEQWFVGFTDGNGCFSVYANPLTQKINLTFKIDQKVINVQVLYYIKRELGVGKVTKPDKQGMCKYVIRDKKLIEKHILPIFENNELKTKKYNNYLRFKKALEIWNDDTLNQTEKVERIYLDKVPSVSRVLAPLSDNWIVGFTEAEGFFYLTLKDKNKISHGFGITQLQDKHLLEEIRWRFTFKAKIRPNNKGWQVETTNWYSIRRLKTFFHKRLKGRMSLIYRIWARSMRHRGKFHKLLKVKNMIKKLRK